jgi:glycosyltransferase involved in cell wall biosynthesis
MADFIRLLVRDPRRVLLWLSFALRGPRRGGGSRFVLLGALAASECDIVHFELSGLAVAYLPVFKLLRPAKIFVSCRGAAEQIKPLADPGRGSDLEKLFSSADRVHCVSQDMLESCKKYGLTEQKAFVNRPAIRADAFTRAAAIPGETVRTRPVRISSTGRLHWKKGFDVALLAIKLLKDSGERVTWEIIGEGPEREKLVYMIHALGLSEIVGLAGKMDSSQVKARLEKSDIFLLPSLSEGISNAALEAMAMELPVISTRSGGMDEVIANGQNGLLVDCYSPEQIASSIRHLITDVSLRNELGKNARLTILKRFSLERQIMTFTREYASARSTQREDEAELLTSLEG